LVAKSVFLDTEIFVQQNFQYDIGLLSAFRHKVKSGQIHFITTEITLQEIDRRLTVSLSEAEAALDSFRKKARILRNIYSPPINRVFKKLSRKKLLKELRKQFNEYIEVLQPNILKTDSVKPSVVFQRYFKSTPPFHQTKKKSEFPDAFAIAALINYCLTNNSKITIISGDPDWRYAIKEYDHLFEYEDRLDIYLHNIQKETPYFDKAQIALNKLMSSIESIIKEEIHHLGFIIDDPDAKTKKVEISEISHRNTYIVDVQPDTIIFSIDFSVRFLADLEYDINKLIGDSLHQDSATIRLSRRYNEGEIPEYAYGFENISAIGSINWDQNNTDNAEVNEITIDNPKHILLYVEDYFGS
jgi:hypothetical protein